MVGESALTAITVPTMAAIKPVAEKNLYFLEVRWVVVTALPFFFDVISPPIGWPQWGQLARAEEHFPSQLIQ